MWEFIGRTGTYYKLNANCKESEKSGEGPGSCGGKTNNDSVLGGEQIQSNPVKLIELFKNDKTYKSELGKLSKVLKEASPKELGIIKNYTEYNYSNINNNLWSGNAENSDISVIDSMMEKSKMEKPFVLYRGMRINDFKKSFQEFNKTGYISKQKGFVSTSLDKSVAFKNGSIILEIDAPKGTNAIYIDDINPYLTETSISGGGKVGHEFEMLLDRNLNFEIVKPPEIMFKDLDIDSPLQKYIVKVRIISDK